MKFYIMKHEIDNITKKINRIINKCKKDNIEYIFNVSEPFERSFEYRETMYSFTVHEVEIEVKFKLNGWRCLGCIIERDGVRQCYFEDNNDLKKYHNVEFKCEHCHKNVNRKSVIIFQHDNGEVKIVGTSCAKEFSCGLDGELIAQYNDVYSYISSINFNNVEDEIIDDDGFNSFFDESLRGYGRVVYPIKLVIALAKRYIDLDGYKPTVQYGYETSTAYDVRETIRKYENIYNRDFNRDELDYSDKVYNWVMNFDEEKRLSSNYFYNLYEIFEKEYCDETKFGMVCSSVVSYSKEIEKELKKRDKNKSEYIGEVGEVFNGEVTLIKTVSYETYFGLRPGTSFIHIMMDNNTNIITWNTSKGLWCSEYNRRIQEGDKFVIKGKIKQHSEYKGEQQTVLTRCKFTAPESFKNQEENIEYVDRPHDELLEEILTI